MDDGPYQNLMSQYHKIRRHNNQGAFKTRARYDAAISGFCRFVASEFNLQKLTNVQGKHLEAYVRYMSEKGRSTSTIKTGLSAIRYMVDRMPGRDNKPALPSNEELVALRVVPKRVFTGIDRAWTDEEYTYMVDKALQLDRPLVAYALGMGWSQGLRIHEVMQIDHDRATKALQNGVLTVRGKGGLWRDVEVTDLGRQILTDALKLTPRGERCFVEKPRVTHQQIESVQRFIRDHRKEIEIDKKTCETRDAAYLKSVAADGYQPHITFHGLRHAYARRLYYDCLQRGMKPFDARKYVAKRLGHGRDAVTRIYLGNVEFGSRFRHLADGFRTLRKPPEN